MKLEKKKSLLQRRRWRIRKKITGTAERPRRPNGLDAGEACDPTGWHTTGKSH